MKLSRVSFVYVLPMLAFSLTVAAIAVGTAFGYRYLLSLSHNGSDANIAPPGMNFSVIIERKHFLRESFNATLEMESRPIEALNLPVGLLDLAAINAFWRAPAQSETHIGGPNLRSLLYPILGIPCWALIGLGCDGLFRRRRLPRPLLLAGTLAVPALIFCLVLSNLLWLNLTGTDAGDLTFVPCGLALWTVLFAVFPATWLRDWWSTRSSRTTRA